MLWYISRIWSLSKLQWGGPNENQRAQQAARNDHRRRQRGDDGACPHRHWRGATITASITNEAVDELKLKKGEKAYAVIKATDVMVGLD